MSLAQWNRSVREASSWSSRRVLDVASGDGRNALWLATQGFTFTAIDISASAVATLQSTAAARAVAIATRVVDLDMPRHSRVSDRSTPLL